MGIEQNGEKLFFDDDDDALLCCEEQEESEVILSEADSEGKGGVFLSLLRLLEQDLEGDDEELHTLLAKEKESFVPPQEEGDLAVPRREAVEWLLKMNAHYVFAPLTAILAVDYLDRFLSTLSFQRDKPWMMQLGAVACLSLAAKVEETYVPLLLDLQVQGTKYVFEAKTIQRMELLVLSALKWRMNPVTPLSFLHHIIRRPGFRSHLHLEFLRNCENLLLFILSESRFRWFPPSVLAAASMLHVVHDAEPEKAAVDYEAHLLSVLKISKEDVNRCYQLLSGKPSNTCRASKRKSQSICPNDSLEAAESCVSSASSSDSIHRPILKKIRVTEQQMRLGRTNSSSSSFPQNPVIINESAIVSFVDHS